MNTEIVIINPENFRDSLGELRRGAEIICNGGLVVFPTETVYGLGGDATNPDAARKIYEAKGRPSDNPLIIHISRPEDAEKYTYTSDMYYKLADRFMPGPLTVIMPSKESVAITVRAGLSTVAVRCPVNPIANKLIELAGVPIAAPSANLSGSPSPTCGRHVIADMNGRVDMIIDGGSSDIGVESTIVKINSDNSLTLLRPGAVTLEDLRSITPHVDVADAVLHSLKEGETVLSPGMKYKHYAPRAEFTLLDGNAVSRLNYVKEKTAENPGLRTAVLCFSEDIDGFSDITDSKLIFNVGKSDDLRMQAHTLFYCLRTADEYGSDRIFAPLPTTDGLGMALYNRMLRAAAHKIVKL